MAKGKYEYWLTPEGLLKLEGWAKDGLSDEQIANNMGISRSTLNDWKKKYSDISDTLKRGKEVVDREVENALLKRALGYSYKEITKERIVDTGQKKRHGGQSELTEREWVFAKKYFKASCAYCGTYTKKLTKDHLKPLSAGGVMSRDNIIPACQKCNSSKKDNEWLSWFQKQTFYDKQRARKICDYVEFVISLGDLLDESTGQMVVTKEVTKEVQPDTTAQIFWLKNRKPDIWRDGKNIHVEDDTEKREKIDNIASILEQMRPIEEGD